MWQFITLGVLGKRIRVIPTMLKDKSVPKRKKAVVIFGLIFLIIPLEFILPVIGLLGDIILWIWILSYLREELDKYWLGEKPQDLSKKFRGKNVVSDVEYEIKDEGKEE